MDRKLFDMSEFYRTNTNMQSEQFREEHSQINTESGGDCADPLTMVFINMQPLDSVYPLSEAFDAGTLFPNLNKPFYGGMNDER